MTRAGSIDSGPQRSEDRNHLAARVPLAGISSGPRCTVRLTKPLRDRIRAGHPWIYDRALAALPPGLAAGDVIALADPQGELALAFADPDSPIRARVLAPPGTPLDPAWAAGRAEAAAARRRRDPLLAGCTGRRLVHGEADALPGLVIDLYDTTCVVVFDGPAAAAFWRPRLPDLFAGLERGGAAIAHAWLRGDRRRTSASGSGLGSGSGAPLRGDPPAEIVIAEDDARFAVDIRAGQKTGFFLDQRDNRRTIRRHAAGQTVLNLFAYTGGFSLHSALGGATHITSVDIAPPAIANLERNLALSHLPATAHELVIADAFDFLARAARQHRRWDLVIADPPSFAPSERTRPAALAAYKKLAAAALAVTAPTGRFALASCSSHITEADLLDQVAGLADLRLRLAAGAASDHPVLPAFPEGRYLKFLLFDVGDAAV
ncbi:MAG: class I SAM-dependent rRNA methyltransferase [Deltaproteobacteria bacterium]|nr:MAG: class I SAM-dependent rRNA methyltransferase [Deltaproteobacteria bacterium]